MDPIGSPLHLMSAIKVEGVIKSLYANESKEDPTACDRVSCQNKMQKVISDEGAAEEAEREDADRRLREGKSMRPKAERSWARTRRGHGPIVCLELLVAMLPAMRLHSPGWWSQVLKPLHVRREHPLLLGRIIHFLLKIHGFQELVTEEHLDGTSLQLHILATTPEDWPATDTKTWPKACQPDLLSRHTMI